MFDAYPELLANVQQVVSLPIVTVADMLAAVEEIESWRRLGPRFGGECHVLGGLVNETPGADRMRLLLEADGELWFTTTWLKKRRAALSLASGMPLAEIDAMAIAEFAATLHGDNPPSRRNGKWAQVHALLDNELGADSWDGKNRSQRAREWSERYGLKLTPRKLGELIRSRRKQPGRDD